MSRPRSVYAALLHQPPEDEWLAAARSRDRRLEAVGSAAGIAGLLDPGSLVAFPLGLLQAANMLRAEAAAEEVARIAEQAGIAAVFGIDVIVDGDADVFDVVQSYVFACDGGQRVLWPARQVRPTRRDGVVAAPSETRCLDCAGRRVAIVIGCEVFSPTLRQALERERPELIVVLTHAGPTPRWRAALDAMQRVAPVLVTGSLADGGRMTPTLPAWTRAPVGWSASVVSRQPRWTLQKFQRAEAGEVHVAAAAPVREASAVAATA